MLAVCIIFLSSFLSVFVATLYLEGRVTNKLIYNEKKIAPVTDHGYNRENDTQIDISTIQPKQISIQIIFTYNRLLISHSSMAESHIY